MSRRIPAWLREPCDLRYRAANDGGPRDVRGIGWIVLHSTEGDTAVGAAAFFASGRTVGSAHLAVDDSNCFRCVPDDVSANGVTDFNGPCLHLEQAGHAGWLGLKWLAHRRELHRTAYHVAKWHLEHRVPLRFVGVAGLRRGDHGVTRHLDCSLAFHHSTHTDPGKDYPVRRVLRLARSYARTLDRGNRPR